MDENKNRPMRPRRSIEDVSRGDKKPAVRPAAPRPAMSVPKPSEVKPPVNKETAPKPSEVKPPVNKEAVPKAAKPPVTENKSAQGGDENEKTRITEAPQGVKLKVPVRKNDDTDRAPSVFGGIFLALVYMAAVIAVSVGIAYFAIQFGNDVFAFVKPDTEIEVVIPEDASFKDVANVLGKNKVIKYPLLFRLYATFSGDKDVDEDGNSVFIPGTYTVTPMKNYMQLLAYFQKQPKVREIVWVTFPEGMTVEEMITVLVDEYGIASREDFKSAINEYDYDFEFLEGIDSLSGRYYRLEGYLFPDTYQFYTDSTAETVVYKMLLNFEDKLEYLSYGETTYKDRLSELGMTLDEVVTLASIIEEEVKYPIDYDQVSSVFHNRLNNKANYPTLGSDATTVYAITMATGKRPETLGATELAFDSPYNTRKSAGLTPGAIANPGFEALYSAFYPADTKYYYFVADEYGYNLYAKTEAAHERNKASIKKDK